MELHKGGKEYLKTILVLEQQSGIVRSLDVSKALHVTKPSVSKAMKRLREGGLPDHGCGQTDPPDANRAHHSRTEHRKTPSPNGLPDLHGRRSCRCRTGRQRHGARHQLGNPGPDEAFCGYERTFAIVLLRTISYGNGASRTNAPFSAPGYVGVTSPKTKPPASGWFCFGGATRNRTGDEGFADPCLTAWPWRRTLYEKAAFCRLISSGAGNGARTRHLSLGKAALYQMSYSRIKNGASEWT